MAGVRNINTFNSIMKTWDEAKELAGMVEEDPNYYLEVQEKSMNSIQSHMDTLKATMQDFWYNFLNQDAINSGLSALNAVAETLTGLVTTAQQLKDLPAVGDTLSTLLLGTGAVGIPALIDNIAKARSDVKKGKINDLSGGFATGFKNTLTQLSQLGMSKDAIQGIGDGYQKGVFGIFKQGFDTAKASGLGFLSSMKGGLKDMWNSLTGIGKAAVSVGGAFLAYKAISETFDMVTTSAEESRKAVSDANAEYTTQREESANNKTTLDSIGEEWRTLSEGVYNATNQNVSLSNEEYQRFLDLNNQIAQILPSTVSGFDAQGNAILNLTGSLQKLNEAYSEQVQNEAFKRFNENSEDYIHEFKRIGGKDSWWNQLATAFGGGDVSDTKGVQETLDLIDKIQEYEDIGNLKNYVYGTDDGSIKGLDTSSRRYLEDTFDLSKSTTQEEWDEILNNGGLKAAIQEQESILEEGDAGIKNLMQDYLTTMTEGDGEYTDLSDNFISNFSKFIQQATHDQIEQIGNSKTSIMASMNQWIEGLSETPATIDAFNRLSKLSDDSSLQDILFSYNNDLQKVADAVGHDKEIVAEQFNLKDADKMQKTYDDIVKESKKFNKEQKKGNKEIKTGKELMDDFIDERSINSLEDLKALKDILEDVDNFDDLERKFTIENFDTEGIEEQLNSLKDNIESVENAFDLMNEVMTNSNSARGMSVEDVEGITSLFENLEGFDYDRLFESTSSGNHLNGEYFEQLQKQLADTEIEKYTKKIGTLQEQYQDWCIAVEEATNAEEKNYAIQQRDFLSDKINKAKEYQSQIEGITNAVNLWQQAEARGDEGDLYDDVVSGLEGAKEMFKEGLIGDDGFQAFTQMFSNQDLTGLGSDKIAEIFQAKLPQMESWLQEGSVGVNNFIKDVAKLNEGLIDAQGNVNFDTMPDVQTLANQLGVSESLIDTMFKKLNQYGADIDFSEAADNLRSLRQEAVDAGASLDEATKEKYSVDLDVEGEDAIEDQIKTLEDMKKQAEDTGEGGAEALEYIEKQADYLNARLGELEAPEIDWESPEGISELQDQLATLNKEADVKIKIDWDNEDPSYYIGKIDEIGNSLDNLKNEDGTIDIETPGAKEALSLIQNLQDKMWSLNSNNLSVAIDTSSLDSSTSQVITDLSNVQSAAQNLMNQLQQQSFGFDVDTSQAEADLQSAISTFSEAHPEATATLKAEGIDTASNDLAALASQLTNMPAADIAVKLNVPQDALNVPVSDTTVNVKYTKDSSAVDNYDPKDHTRTVTYNLNSTAVDSYNPRNISRTVTYTVQTKGEAPKVHGNAHAQGNANSVFAKGRALAHGVWGATKDSMSLVGELGR